MLWRRHPAATALLAAGLVLAVLAAGCSRQPVASRASVESCTQFGIAAIRHHVTVTVLPPACKGLTNAQVSFAVGSALHSAAIGARGKAAQRRRIGAASRYLQGLVVAAPARRGVPRPTAVAAPRISRTAVGLAALCAWLITVGLGLLMMARWILRRRRGRRTLAGRLRRPPALNFAHLGLASTSLLVWIAYLATGMTALAWTACVLLALVTGLGMTLVFLSPPAGPAARSGGAGRGGPAGGRRAPVLTLGSHIAFATVTILLAVLAAIGAA